MKPAAAQGAELKEWLEAVSDLIRLQGRERASYILSEVLSFAAQEGLTFDLSSDVVDYLSLTHGMTDHEIDRADKQLRQLTLELSKETKRADRALDHALASLTRAGVL